MAASVASAARWLLVIHQIPPTPPYLRVKIGRRLQRVGAVAIKNTVYALPSSETAREHFEWVLREVAAGGGDGSICEARFVDGLTDPQLEAMFTTARDADYAPVTSELRRLERRLPKRRGADVVRLASLGAELERLRRRLDEIAAIDFFGASGRVAAHGVLRAIERRLADGSAAKPTATLRELDPSEYQGRTWVTRKGIHVDRIASAWLIQRFVDPRARMKFVAARGYRARPNEVRFDMFDGELTHEGDLCAFEAIVQRMGMSDAGLRRIAEIVHDIDLRDAKFAHPETPGIERIIASIALAHRDDVDRLARGSAVLDDLYELYRKIRGPT